MVLQKTPWTCFSSRVRSLVTVETEEASGPAGGRFGRPERGVGGEGAACPGTRAAEGEAGLASGLVTGAAAAMAAAPAGRSRDDEQSFREVVASARRGAGKGRRWG